MSRIAGRGPDHARLASDIGPRCGAPFGGGGCTGSTLHLQSDLRHTGPKETTRPPQPARPARTPESVPAVRCCAPATHATTRSARPVKQLTRLSCCVVLL